MADSSVTYQSATAATPPSGTPVSTRTNASSEQMQVVVQGIDGSDSVVPSSAANGLTVDVTRVAGNVTVVQPTAANLKVDGSAVTQPVSGTVSAAQSGTWTVQPGNTANTTAWMVDGSAVTQPVSGTVTAAMPAVAAATVTQVASSATNVTLQASNAARKGLLIFNDSTAILRVKFGATASATSYTVQIAAGGYYEMPIPPVYTGIVDGIWAAANGNAYVTEL